MEMKLFLPKGFTSEGVLVTESNTTTTPRRRKSPGTGFTPVRNTIARPMMTLVEPERVEITLAVAPPLDCEGFDMAHPASFT